MGRAPCCEKNGVKKGPWTAEEDKLLIDYIHKNGCGNWRTLPNNAGLQRCGKSCRLRWTNYLRPDIKRGKFSFQEEETIIHLHSILGNKWSSIAARLPGRTDNEIKNYWNTRIRKRLLRMGIDPVTHHFRPDLLDLASQINSSNPTPFQSPCTNNLDLVRLTSSLMQLSDDQVQQLVQMKNPFNGFMIHEPAHQLMHYDDVAGFGSEQGASLLGECGYYGSDRVVVDPGSSLESCTFEVDSSGSFGLQSVFSNISTLLSSPTALQFELGYK